jgi:hypothetical protein
MVYLTVGRTCDLNMLGTRMEALVLFRNRGMTATPILKQLTAH